MTQVDFYSLPDKDLMSRTQLTCRLLEKAISGNHRVLIQVNDDEDAKILSDRIWGYKPESFIPHGLLGESAKNNIEIGCSEDHGDQHDILIVLSDNLPNFFSRFNRVIEITCDQPDILKLSRERFRFYRDRGYPLKHHKLASIMGY